MKKPFHKAESYSNDQAKTEGLAIKQPKDPWWKWPVLFLAFVGVAMIFLFLGKLKELFLNWRR